MKKLAEKIKQIASGKRPLQCPCRSSIELLDVPVTPMKSPPIGGLFTTGVAVRPDGDGTAGARRRPRPDKSPKSRDLPVHRRDRDRRGWRRRRSHSGACRTAGRAAHRRWRGSRPCNRSAHAAGRAGVVTTIGKAREVQRDDLEVLQVVSDIFHLLMGIEPHPGHRHGL